MPANVAATGTTYSSSMPGDRSGEQRRRVAQLRVRGARDHRPDRRRATRTGARCASVVARPSHKPPPLALHRGRERAVVDQLACDALDAADALQRVVGEQHAAARGAGRRAAVVVDPRERIEHPKEEHERGDQQPLPRPRRSAARPSARRDRAARRARRRDEPRERVGRRAPRRRRRTTSTPAARRSRAPQRRPRASAHTLPVQPAGARPRLRSRPRALVPCAADRSRARSRRYRPSLRSSTTVTRTGRVVVARAATRAFARSRRPRCARERPRARRRGVHRPPRHGLAVAIAGADEGRPRSHPKTDRERRPARSTPPPPIHAARTSQHARASSRTAFGSHVRPALGPPRLLWTPRSRAPPTRCSQLQHPAGTGGRSCSRTSRSPPRWCCCTTCGARSSAFRARRPNAISAASSASTAAGSSPTATAAS